MSNLAGRGLSQTVLTSSLAVLLGVLVWAPAAAAIDLTGHWRDVRNAKYAIVQSGTSVTLNGLQGSIDGSNVEVASTDPNFPQSYSLVVSEDESTLTGVRHSFQCVLSFCQYVTSNVTLERCACYDGNTANGDGCDFKCLVEVCNECTAEPSTCTPVADATPCEDPSLCVAGGACSGGTCASGVETAQCIDLSGTWLRGIRGTSGLFDGTGVSRSEFVQAADGTLTVYSLPGGAEQRSGSFDSTTLAIQMDGTGSFPNCGLGGLDGAVAADGNTYMATDGFLAPTPHGCFGYAPYDEFGVRCAPPALEPPDGCSVDSCQRCEGDPAVCEPVPDWTPCESDDPCAVVSTCHAGQCVAAFSQYCPSCSVCDGSGGCSVGPRDDCRAATTKFSIKNVEGSARRSLRWDWKDGGPVAPSEIARPDVSSEVGLCVFDESGVDPVLLYSDSINDYYLEPGWSVDSSGSMRFRSRTDAISAIDLRVGDAPKLGVKTSGEALPLPVPEVSLPIRVQLQIQDGSCFEGSYGTDDVRRNANGILKAVTAP
ncbi:MAG TPA: hypothetical protein VN634_15995 [Candidatus Limnocylindrales bacterium]|nr:hypothetical protein [Candidatus Limnocylindrales bacterium]